MSDTQASLTTSLERYCERLTDLKGRLHKVQAPALSWRKNYSD